MSLKDMISKAKSFLGAKPIVGTATDAVRADRYDKMLFQEILDEVPPIRDLVDELGGKYDYAEQMVADALNQFWQSDPQVRSQSAMDVGYLTNHAVATDIKSAPETAETRTYTQHDKYGAAMATIAVGGKIREFLKKNKELQEEQEKAKQAQQEQDAANQAAQDAQDAAEAEAGEYDGEGPLTAGQQAALDALQAALDAAAAAAVVADQATEDAQGAAKAAQTALRAPIREAVKDAGDELAEEAEMLRAWGVDPGELQQMNFSERADLARMLRSNRLNKFRALIGRFRMMAAAQRSRKIEFARDEVYSTEMSDRLPDVIGSEFAHLANKHTRLDFLTRLAEGQLLSRKYRGDEKVGQGAIIFLCDNSGSMSICDSTGMTREAWAKAFMLAMLDQARAAKRDFVGINFSSRGEQRVWRFPAGKCELRDVIEMTEHFFGGGTDFEQPLDKAMDILEAEFNETGKQRADLVLCTDDDCRVSIEWQKRYQARKDRLGFRTFGIAVGMANPGGALTALSDNVRAVTEFADPTSVADIMRVV